MGQIDLFKDFLIWLDHMQKKKSLKKLHSKYKYECTMNVIP